MLIIPENVKELSQSDLFAFPKGLTIMVRKGSVAEGYAKKYASDLEQANLSDERIIVEYF